MSDFHGSKVFFGRIFIIAAAVLWGTSGAIQSIAPEGASPAIVGTMRIFIAGLFLTSTALIKKEINNFKSFFSPILFVTGFCQAMFQFCYFSGISLTGVAVGAMVAIGSSPFFTGILGKFYENESLSKRWYFSTFTAVFGLVLLMSDGSEITIDILGIVFALGAGFSYALFTLFAKKIIRLRSADGIIGISFLIGTIYMIPFLFIHPISWIISSKGFFTVFYLGFISAGISYMFYGRGLKNVNVSTVGTLTLAEPLTASVLGIFVLGEDLTLYSGIGMGLIFISQLIVLFQPKRVVKA